MKVLANVYVDGFNLYYGCVKGTPYKWLNLSKLCTMLLPRYQINRIRYFTALVSPEKNDRQKVRRQLTYIRALKTIHNLSVHYGQFLTHVVRRPLATSSLEITEIMEVLDTKEKGSDVNLASYLLVDGFKKEYQTGVIISNDSDLVEPIKLATSELGLEIGILHPHERPVKELSQVAKFYRPIREKVLKACLFPPQLQDVNGIIHKPDMW